MIFDILLYNRLAGHSEQILTSLEIKSEVMKILILFKNFI